MAAEYDERARALSALHAIPPDVPRDEWVRVGMAAQAAGLALDDFDEWSSGADTYKAADCHATWRSFEPGGGIGPGTLFHIAREHGYRRPVNDSKTPEGGPPRRGPDNTRQRPTNGPRGVAAAEVWARWEQASGAHRYIVAKQGKPDGLRVVPEGDPLRIAGRSVAGWLAVPVRPLDGGEPVSLQFIPPPGAGKKLNLPGAPMAGVFIVGELVPGGTAHLCEGIGQAWACWRATGHAAVVTFGWSRVRAVAAELRQRDPSARMVLVPDAGKEAEAESIAREVGAQFVTMPDGSSSNFDANDLALRDGIDALEELLASAKAPTQHHEASASWRLVSLVDLAATPPQRWLWDGYIPAGHVTLFGAHGGTGKSTIALMLAVSVALGRPLFGVHTEPAPVVFYSAEDPAQTVRLRLARLLPEMRVNDAELRGRMTILDATEHTAELVAPLRLDGDFAARRNALALTPTGVELADVLAGMASPLLIVDNASDTFGGDENARPDVRAFVRLLAQMVRKQDGAVLLLAHIDKNAARGFAAGQSYSGSTAWHNSARSRLAMKRDGDGALLIEHEKCNLGPLREPLRLLWPRDGVPDLDAQATGIVGRIAEENHSRALLRLVHEFTARGEWVPTATSGPSTVTQLMCQAPTYPRRLKSGEVFELLRDAERRGWLERVTYANANRKTRVRWEVTPPGCEATGLPTAPVAPVAPVPETGTTCATANRPAPVAAVPAPGGVGGMERASGASLPAHRSGRP